MISKCSRWFSLLIKTPFNHPLGIGSKGLNAGFTLLELIIIIAIVGTLAGIAIPVYTAQINKARIFKAISDIKIIEKEIEAFKMDEEALPVSLDEIGREDLKDPWGNPYQYINHDLLPKNPQGKPKGSRKNKNEHPINLDYDLFCMGPDGKFNLSLTAKASYDDIIRADEGRYVGTVYEF